LVAGQGFIVLKRHCERVGDLTDEEQASLGQTLTRTAQAMDIALKPEKVHFGLYAEGAKHIHLHVTPRVAILPAGNIPLVWLATWNSALEGLKLRKPISDAQVMAVAEALKAAFQQLA
jgi:diadenosine tetraphosphate (Ap4A) HIT family hydrolase